MTIKRFMVSGVQPSMECSNSYWNMPLYNFSKLEQNYRSTSCILDAANAVIENNQARLGKALWTHYPKGELIRTALAESEESEARGMIRWIQQSIKAGISPTDIAILYRTNVQSRAFEQALMQARIPYRVYGGMRFF